MKRILTISLIMTVMLAGPVSCKKQEEVEIADAQFDKMIKSCDACHEGYKKKNNESSE